jgi:hypothetical protein
MIKLGFTHHEEYLGQEVYLGPQKKTKYGKSKPMKN